MSGSGAMFGAFDVGVFITKGEGHARRLAIHADTRDGAAPEDFIVTLQGEGSAAHGGFTYRDELRLVREDIGPKEESLKAPPVAIRVWIVDRCGRAKRWCGSVESV